MLQKKNYVFWFCTGSQDLYGEECLAKVADRRCTECIRTSSL